MNVRPQHASTPPYLVMLVIFTLGNSSDAFLMLRAQTLGFQPVEIFLLLAGFNLVITVSSTPAGALRMDHLVVGLAAHPPTAHRHGAFSRPAVDGLVADQHRPTAHDGHVKTEILQEAVAHLHQAARSARSEGGANARAGRNPRCAPYTFARRKLSAASPSPKLR